MTEQKKVEELTTEELEALFYDNYKVLLVAQQAINIIEAELEKRKNESGSKQGAV